MVGVIIFRRCIVEERKMEFKKPPSVTEMEIQSSQKIIFVTPNIDVDKLELNVNDGKNILHVKQLLCEKEEFTGVTPDDITIIYLGKILGNSVIVNSLRITWIEEVSLPAMNVIFSRTVVDRIKENLKTMNAVKSRIHVSSELSCSNASGDEDKNRATPEEKSDYRGGDQGGGNYTHEKAALENFTLEDVDFDGEKSDSRGGDQGGGNFIIKDVGQLGTKKGQSAPIPSHVRTLHQVFISQNGDHSMFVIINNKPHALKIDVLPIVQTPPPHQQSLYPQILPPPAVFPTPNNVTPAQPQMDVRQPMPDVRANMQTNDSSVSSLSASFSRVWNVARDLLIYGGDRMNEYLNEPISDSNIININPGVTSTSDNGSENVTINNDDNPPSDNFTTANYDTTTSDSLDGGGEPTIAREIVSTHEHVRYPSLIGEDINVISDATLENGDTIGTTSTTNRSRQFETPTSQNVRALLGTLSRIFKFIFIFIIINTQHSFALRMLIKIVAIACALSMSSISGPSHDVLNQQVSHVFRIVSDTLRSYVDMILVSPDGNDEHEHVDPFTFFLNAVSMFFIWIIPSFSLLETPSRTRPAAP